jgi:hypothetical protein
MKNLEDRAVMVTTEFRGVFFGYMSQMPKNGSVTLKRARNCVYWSADVKGFMGLAANGPSKSCRIGPAVPSIKLEKITAVVEVSPEAAEKWEIGIWSN